MNLDISRHLVKKKIVLNIIFVLINRGGEYTMSVKAAKKLTSM